MMDNTKPTLEQLLDAGERHAREILLNLKKPALQPFYHLVAGDPGEHDAILPCEFANEDDKDVAVTLAYALGRIMKAVAVLFVSEAWMARYAQDEVGTDTDGETVMPNTRPSQHPARVEVVSLVASDGTNVRGRSLTIVRNKRGRITKLERGPMDDTRTTIAGRMIDGIIPPATTH